MNTGNFKPLTPVILVSHVDLFPRFAVLDLAARFADGRLSTEKLLQADDEELYEMLIAVRGIGRVSHLM